jgi:hypothetical protein
MSLHINRFLDRVSQAESRRQRDVSMTVQEARDLHNDITRLLLIVTELQQNRSESKSDDAQTTVEIQGGTW